MRIVALEKHVSLPEIAAHRDNVFSQEMTGLNRAVSETLQAQVYITTSGIFTQPPLYVAIATSSINHIIFSVDYSCNNNQQGKAFLDSMAPAPADNEKIAYGNTDRLLKLSKQ